MSNKILLTLTAASTVALVVAVGSWNLSETRSTRASDAAGAPALASPPPAGGTAPSESGALPGAALLEGVDMVDGITLHTDGSLVYSLPLRHLFDHMLGMAGAPERVPDAREALKWHLQSTVMSAASREQALEAFDLYLGYLKQAEQIELNSYEAGDLERTFDLLAGLRRSILGPTLAEAFFADEEALEQVIVAQRRIAEEQLTPTAREDLYAELEEALPEHLREARSQTTQITRLSRETAALRSAGATEATIQQMREQRVGYEAAERLSDLDRARDEWAQRVEAYQRERDALLRGGTLGPEDQGPALARLRGEFFSENEVRRITALDRAATSP